MRPSLLILFSGQVSDQVEVLLTQAWRLRSRVLSHRPLSPQPLREMDVQIILLPAEEEGQGDGHEDSAAKVALGSAAVAVVDKMLDTLQQQSSLRPLELALGTPASSAEGTTSTSTATDTAAAAR